MRVTGWMLAGAAIMLLGGGLIWNATRNVAPAASERPGESSDVGTEGRQLPAPSGARASRADQAPAVAGSDFEARFREADDYLAFVRSVVPAAEAGDPAAQLALFRAMDFCGREYPFYFRIRTRELTLDEGLARATTRWPFNAEYARQLYQRCHDLLFAADVDTTSAARWLERASTAGNPRAQALWVAHLYRLAVEAMAEPPKAAEASGTPSGKTIDLMRLAGSALRSRDPEVVMEIGQLVPILLGEDIPEYEHLSWTLAACQRGADCGPTSLRTRFWCMGNGNRCHPADDLVALLRADTGGDFQAIERRAFEINRLIDEGRWEALGFGATLENVPDSVP